MSMLQRRAFGEGKTTSRKAKSKASSQASSRVASRVNSAINSPAHTDVEYDSDDTTFSFGSAVDEMRSIEELQLLHLKDWNEEVNRSIQRIRDWRKAGFEERENSLLAYNRLLLANWSEAAIDGKEDELYEIFLRSLKQGKTEREMLFAVKAIALTILTSPTSSAYSTLATPLRQTIIDASSEPLKCVCIHALGFAAFFGGASAYTTESVMEFLKEIVESDGGSVAALDSSTVVTAAIQAWGFLATSLEDAENVTQESIEVFVDQLDSSEIDVQVAAGEVIALLYEKAHHWTDEGSDSDDHIVQRNPTGYGGWARAYQVYPRQFALMETLQQLSSGSKKYLSKRNRRTQHTVLGDVLRTVEEPWNGPRYSDALDEEGRKKGHRLAVRTGKDRVVITKWSQLLRLNSLRRLLGGGWGVHWAGNPNVSGCID